MTSRPARKPQAAARASEDTRAAPRTARAADRVIRDYDEAARRADGLRKRGRRIVFTNGVFDLFHLGHLRMLEEARRLGDALIVGVNSDSSVKRIKGRERPIIDETARAEIVAGVSAVEFCVIFTEKDPGRLLRFLRPDVLVKGAEYALSKVVGKRFVESYGGRVALAPHLEGWSSTEILGRIGGSGERRAARMRTGRRAVKGNPSYTTSAYDTLESVPKLRACVVLIGGLLGMSGETVRAALRKALSSGRRTMLFILTDFANGKPAGFAYGNIGSGIESGEYFWLNELHVAEDHRGRGGGRALMEHVFDWCRLNKLRAVYGVCAADNTKAEAFYGKIGFSTRNITWLVKRLVDA